jgi:hypothetical protein
MRRGRAAAQFAKTAALGHARCKLFIDQTACWQRSFVHLVRLRRALKLLGQPDIMPTIEPVSGRSPFPGKSDFGVQRQNGHNVRRGRVRESRDQVGRAKGANTRVFGAAPENLRGAATVTMGPLNQCQLGGRTAHGSLSLVVQSPGRRQAPSPPNKSPPAHDGAARMSSGIP